RTPNILGSTQSRLSEYSESKAVISLTFIFVQPNGRLPRFGLGIIPRPAAILLEGWKIAKTFALPHAAPRLLRAIQKQTVTPVRLGESVAMRIEANPSEKLTGDKREIEKLNHRPGPRCSYVQHERPYIPQNQKRCRDSLSQKRRQKRCKNIEES